MNVFLVTHAQTTSSLWTVILSSEVKKTILFYFILFYFILFGYMDKSAKHSSIDNRIKNIAVRQVNCIARIYPDSKTRYKVWKRAFKMRSKCFVLVTLSIQTSGEPIGEPDVWMDSVTKTKHELLILKASFQTIYLVLLSG